jgi:hypothetical protein
VCERLVASPLAGRLQVFQLMGFGSLSDHGLMQLASHASVFGSLVQLAIKLGRYDLAGRRAVLAAGLPLVQI